MIEAARMIELVVVVAGLLASLLAAADTVPYVRDTLRGSTIPHRGTWLIWSVLALVATAAQHADGARWSLLPLAVQAACTSLVFVLSLRLGCGGLTRADIALLALAGIGVVGWVLIDAPPAATASVICADLIAASMMLPKTWRDPHSETLSTYLLAAAGGVLTVAAVGSLSVPLLAYPVYFVLVNGGLATVIFYRRRVLAASGIRVTPPALLSPAPTAQPAATLTSTPTIGGFS